MRPLKMLVLCTLLVVGVSVISIAATNGLGVAEKREVTFLDPIRVGNATLHPGTYVVKHTMEGENHIMVFRRREGKDPLETRVKCTLVPLPEKAQRDQKIYTHNDQDQHVLQALEFKGDTARHVF